MTTAGNRSPCGWNMWRCLGLVTAIVISLSQESLSIKCSVCETSSWGYDCVTNPPPAQQCQDSHSHCLTLSTHLSNGKLDMFARTCSPFAMPDTCSPGIEKSSGRPVDICFSTCTLDDCNRSGSLHRILNLLRRRRRSVVSPHHSQILSLIRQQS